MIEGGVINITGGDSKVALVYGQMNEPPGARARVALTGLTVAEYFRDQEGQDVLLFIDNIFRFTQVNIIGPMNFTLVLVKMAGEIINIFRPVPKYPPFWVVSHPLSVTNQPWPPIWVKCRKELPPPRRVPLPPSKPSMSQLMT